MIHAQDAQYGEGGGASACIAEAIRVFYET